MSAKSPTEEGQKPTSSKNPSSPKKRTMNAALKSFANSRHRSSAAGEDINDVEVELTDVENNKDKVFEYSHGLTSEEAAYRLAKYGRNELPEKHIPKWYIFVSQLWQPMPVSSV